MVSLNLNISISEKQARYIINGKLVLLLLQKSKILKVSVSDAELMYWALI